MCSSVLGPAMPPPLVTWPTTITAIPLSFAKRISSAGALPHLPDVAGRALERFGVHRLDRIEHQHGGTNARGGLQHRLEAGLAEHADIAGGVAQPVGPQPELLGRFLAAGIQHPATAGLQPRGGLEQQGRLADAGLAADQRHRARHDAAAEHEVEFGEAGGPALEARCR